MPVWNPGMLLCCRSLPVHNIPHLLVWSIFYPPADKRSGWPQWLLTNNSFSVTSRMSESPSFYHCSHPLSVMFLIQIQSADLVCNIGSSVRQIPFIYRKSVLDHCGIRLQFCNRADCIGEPASVVRIKGHNSLS